MYRTRLRQQDLGNLVDIGPAVADPGLPIGEASLTGGRAPTPDVATFHKICMSKQKNRDH